MPDLLVRRHQEAHPRGIDALTARSRVVGRLLVGVFVVELVVVVRRIVREDDPPRLAALLSLAIAILTLGLGTLDAIAAVVSMFFLTVYGMVNIVRVDDGRDQAGELDGVAPILEGLAGRAGGVVVDQFEIVSTHDRVYQALQAGVDIHFRQTIPAEEEEQEEKDGK